MANLTLWRRRVKDDLFGNPIVARSLRSSLIEAHCRQAGHRWRDSFWSPPTTVLAFLLQVLDGAKTLRAAVALMLTQWAARGETDLPSGDPSAFCQARQRLPLAVVKGLLGSVSDILDRRVPRDRRLWQHRVKVFDGSTASMPDTPDLQTDFPQPAGQKPGCGFPVIYFVALFCWSTGAVLAVASGNLHAGELVLFRQLWDQLQMGDILLADRAYSAYVDLARLLQRDIRCVVRMRSRRKSATGFPEKHLGPDDRLVTWRRPRRWVPSFGISPEEFERLPETMTVRLIRVIQVPSGFRSQSITIATTLLDPMHYPADEIRALYRDRWTAELNFRSLKTHLGMDVLHGESPDVVLKELHMHLLAYNLIRLVMWQAAQAHGGCLHRLSFTGTFHRLRAALPLLLYLSATGSVTQHTLALHVLACVAQDRVPHRPDRLEPRRKKRRPKGYSLLQQPRAWYRTHGESGAP
jgi:hypothetical protein